MVRIHPPQSGFIFPNSGQNVPGVALFTRPTLPVLCARALARRDPGRIGWFFQDSSHTPGGFPMSKENPAFEGIIDAVEDKGCYGFINKPCGHAGFGTSVGMPVFVHHTAVGKMLKQGMRIAFDLRPSRKDKHKGKLEAWNIVELYDAPTIS